MRAGFEAAACDWEDSRGGYRRPVLADPLPRGGPFRPGRAVEITSGTGLQTPLIAQVWPEVAAVDLSGGMLARSTARGRVQADAARLPLADGCAAAVVIGDGPLFATEAARVMDAGAVLVWSNALGDGAPFFVPVEVLTGAMTATTGRGWDVVHSQAHWSSCAALSAWDFGSNAAHVGANVRLAQFRCDHIASVREAGLAANLGSTCCHPSCCHPSWPRAFRAAKQRLDRLGHAFGELHLGGEQLFGEVVGAGDELPGLGQHADKFLGLGQHAEEFVGLERHLAVPRGG